MKRRIYILGGGFGGLYAALELERLLGRDPSQRYLKFSDQPA